MEVGNDIDRFRLYLIADFWQTFAAEDRFTTTERLSRRFAAIQTRMVFGVVSEYQICCRKKFKNLIDLNETMTSIWVQVTFSMNTL